MTRELRILVESDPGQGAGLQINDEMVLSRCKAAGINAKVAVNTDPARLIEYAHDVDVIFSNHKFDIGLVRKTAPFFRWIQVISAGVEAYLDTLPDDVVLTNASGVHAEKGAEFILASVLMLNYRIPFFASHKVERNWKPVFESVSRGKTATILGVGAIGGAAVPLLKARGIKVIGVTSHGTTDAPSMPAFVWMRSIPYCLKQIF